MQNLVLFRIYLAGLSGYVAPRALRRLLAGTPWHRAWLVGHLGYFNEQGVSYGPTCPYPGPVFSDVADESV